MKVGGFKLVVAEDADSVKEVLVKKSADYAGRPPFHSFVMTTLGMSLFEPLDVKKKNYKEVLFSNSVTIQQV